MLAVFFTGLSSMTDEACKRSFNKPTALEFINKMSRQLKYVIHPGTATLLLPHNQMCEA